jgi:hypothetical protein
LERAFNAAILVLGLIGITYELTSRTLRKLRKP